MDGKLPARSASVNPSRSAWTASSTAAYRLDQLDNNSGNQGGTLEPCRGMVRAPAHRAAPLFSHAPIGGLGTALV